MHDPVQLSVVIPTFNNLQVLRQNLERWQRFGPGRANAYEIIVIEDGCHDATPAFLAETAATVWGRNHLRWFHEDDAHELICTNRGIAEAKGSIILAWQDDMFVNTSWFVPELVRTFERYQDLGVLSLSRGLEYLPYDTPIERWEDLYDDQHIQSWIGPKPWNWFRLQEVDAVMRPWAVRRKCIEAVGRLDEAFRPTEWDEADLCYRIRKAGWKIATYGYERLGAYTHLGSTTLKMSDAYKAKVLRNGQLFHTRWDDTIRAEHPRHCRTWLRRASLAGWYHTLGRMGRFLLDNKGPASS